MSVKTVSPGDEVKLFGLVIEVCHAYAQRKFAHFRGKGVGYIINFSGKDAGKRLYYTGDTELIPEMENIGPVDIMIIQMNTDDVMDLEEAILCCHRVRARYVVPVNHHEKTGTERDESKLKDAVSSSKVIVI